MANYDKFEELLKKVTDLKKRIDNPGPDRLLSEQRKLKSELEELEKTPGLRLYRNVKKELAIAKKEKRKLYRIAGNGCVCILVEWSETRHPRMLYFRRDGDSALITTSVSCSLLAIDPETFLNFLMSGEGFLRER